MSKTNIECEIKRDCKFFNEEETPLKDNEGNPVMARKCTALNSLFCATEEKCRFYKDKNIIITEPEIQIVDEY